MNIVNPRWILVETNSTFEIDENNVIEEIRHEIQLEYDDGHEATNFDLEKSHLMEELSALIGDGLPLTEGEISSIKWLIKNDMCIEEAIDVFATFRFGYYFAENGDDLKPFHNETTTCFNATTELPRFASIPTEHGECQCLVINEDKKEALVILMLHTTSYLDQINDVVPWNALTKVSVEKLKIHA